MLHSARGQRKIYRRDIKPAFAKSVKLIVHLPSAFLYTLDFTAVGKAQVLNSTAVDYPRHRLFAAKLWHFAA